MYYNDGLAPSCDSFMLEVTPWYAWFCFGTMIMVQVPRTDVLCFLAKIKKHGL